MSRKYPVINMGDPQPVPCDYCNSVSGYQVVDKTRTSYTTSYYPNGEFEQGWYGESITLTKKGVVPHCSNCGSKLKFKINRSKS